MTKPKILSICLLATLLAPLTGCQTQPRHAEAKPSPDHGAQAPVQAIQAPDRAVHVRVREAQAGDQRMQARVRHNEVGVIFSASDIACIHDYYKQGHQPEQPPGESMKLRQGELYPFGYTWRFLPKDLESRLSSLPRGYVRIIVGTDVAILEIHTRVVVDLLENLAA